MDAFIAVILLVCLAILAVGIPRAVRYGRERERLERRLEGR